MRTTCNIKTATECCFCYRAFFTANVEGGFASETEAEKAEVVITVVPAIDEMAAFTANIEGAAVSENDPL